MDFIHYQLIDDPSYGLKKKTCINVNTLIKNMQLPPLLSVFKVEVRNI
jgi:hypothetical protein